LEGIVALAVWRVRCPIDILPLELPGREAPHVDVELVESGNVAIMLELNLEL